MKAEHLIAHYLIMHGSVGLQELGTFTYTGSGIISAVSASLTLTETHPSSSPITIKLDNFVKQ